MQQNYIQASNKVLSKTCHSCRYHFLCSSSEFNSCSISTQVRQPWPGSKQVLLPMSWPLVPVNTYFWPNTCSFERLLHLYIASPNPLHTPFIALPVSPLLSSRRVTHTSMLQQHNIWFFPAPSENSICLLESPVFLFPSPSGWGCVWLTCHSILLPPGSLSGCF